MNYKLWVMSWREALLSLRACPIAEVKAAPLSLRIAAALCP
jgi:hypothetical protein